MTVGTGEAVSPPQPDSAAAGTSVQTPGALLQQERIRRGLSVQQSAEGLHLDTWIVEAIEANQFLALGAPVYAKGYLRKYAMLLGLAPDVIVARYEVLSDTPVVPTPVPIITTTPPQRPKWPAYLAWSLLAALAIAIGLVAYKFLMPAPVKPIADETSATASMPASTSTPIPTPAPTPVIEQAAPVPVTSSDEKKAATPAAPAARDAPAAKAAPAASAPAVVATGPVSTGDSPATRPSPPVVRLRLEFNEASWVEVYDAEGQRLLYDIGQPDRVRIVSGAAPLNVVVGLASAVSVQVNDQTIVVPRQANKDSTRFRVRADGSVQ
jgi:cytoskeleton protein RodZ